jgi:hypothetical protein
LFDYKTILSAVKRVEFVSDEEVAGVISVFWMFVPQERIKLMIWKAAPTRNWIVSLINSLHNIWKCC